MADNNPEPTQPPTNQIPRNHNQLVHVRDRLFQSLFYRGALSYARLLPKSVRRLIEFLILINAIGSFCVLVYIHFSFSQHANTCLDQVVNQWDHSGVLRIEIVKNLEPTYDLDQSYAKEEKLLARGSREHFSSIFGLLTRDLSDLDLTEPLKRSPKGIVETPMSYPINSSHWMGVFQPEKYPILTVNGADIEAKPIIIPDRDDVYIFEYALEYGFLRLGPTTRKRLNIPIQTVFLDPDKHECFGDNFSRFFLNEFLGYQDVIMTSVKSLAEREQNRGYLKNAVTGEHYRFVNLWMAKTAYIPAIVCMLIFTVVVSMLLRYAHHQIFLFIVDLLQMMEFNMTITFPTAPLLTVILALIGIEAMMSEFFNDSTTAFYVILIVWLADQYDAICCHTAITKRHWLKFFYLYHFVFYAYHYRFNGHYALLCLVIHWLFIVHSMVYFFHHYELPVILQQAQVQHLLLRSAHLQQANPNNPQGLGITLRPRFPLLRGRLTQLLSAVRPSATTQTTTIVVSSHNLPNTTSSADVATSTSTITSVVATHHPATVSVGTTVEPLNHSQSIQTMPQVTVESQTSTSDVMMAVSIQTIDEGSRPPPHGGPDQSLQ